MKSRKDCLISVVIPLYNSEKTIKDCLDSVLNQNYNNYEVIVVDNNSTDNSKKIIHKYKKIRYVFEAQRGRGAARNTGVKTSKGEIILMTDSDCIVPSNWISEMIKPILYEEETIVMGHEYDLIGNTWTKFIQEANHILLKKNSNKNYINHLDTKNFAIKSEIAKKQSFDSKMKSLEDFEFYLRIKNSNKIRFLKDISVGHNHKSTFISLMKMQMDRGYWLIKIHNKHKNVTIEKGSMLESTHFLNNLFFPIWFASIFLRNPLKKSIYLSISELSWRIGMLKSKIC